MDSTWEVILKNAGTLLALSSCRQSPPGGAAKPTTAEEYRAKARECEQRAEKERDPLAASFPTRSSSRPACPNSNSYSLFRLRIPAHRGDAYVSNLIQTPTVLGHSIQKNTRQGIRVVRGGANVK
jgi:hypothetical protein